MQVLESQLEQLTARDFSRVNVVGLSGSGKSTFSRRLAGVLGSEYIEMDALFHGPNWSEPIESEFRTKVANSIAGDRWILDGNYHSKTHDLKWERATAIIWVNTPFIRNMIQITSRSINRAWTKAELWPGTGNRESFRRSFLSRESVILWAMTNYYRIQSRYRAIQANPAWDHLPFIELKTQPEAEALLSFVEKLKS